MHDNNGNTPVIALLGQPNSGKSTIFNMMTGSHQHVGNWPGKTVEQKEGTYKWKGQQRILADLPGSYSLSAGSDEEIITKDYIASGNADLVLVMADASQLKRSLYMLADFAGTPVPAVLILNMMDVAEGQGIVIDTGKLSEKLGIPVVPMSAICRKNYQLLYETIEKALAEKPVLHWHTMEQPKEKMAFIDDVLSDVLKAGKTAKNAFTSFDKKALSPVKGKLMAFGIILVIFLLAMIFAGIISGIASAVLTPLAAGLKYVMEQIHVHPLLISLVCDVLVNVLYFACMMASFVLGITLGFNLMEETGYLARISFLFDYTMSKVGLQGKTIMPFFMGLGCTIAGTTGTRVVDNWGQRVLAIAMSWAVPCAATLSVVPTIAIALFGSTGGFLVIVSIFLFMFLMMWVVYKVFGNSLSPKEERVGLIMELPPYHKPDLRNILYVTFQRTFDIFLRALRVITLVSIAFFVLTYGFGGSPETSILYRIGVIIEPVTMFFGLKWQAFLAFCASAISKESLLGVLNTLYGTGGSLVSSTFGAKTAGSAAGISEILSANFTKAQGLAFIFAISFNMPCVSALAATARETHSVRWTAKIGVFYTAAALLVSCIVYHVGLLVF
ncbi:ferrous iron transporter B [Kineothrix sp. MSJ-39]|uniref:ferrous iron transporter B n=1 Tax=Kineothrix sp. MSJ-39 TaxID=2841533 RepID=UPI001C103450|nr:ferrous iron transporter B [Kineothrix sp. MSJ-39]MBU5428946.1 ferrous iron transporter B [Kineothrix sp. MSJ-39]